MRRVPGFLTMLIICASASAEAQSVRISAGKANWSASGTTVTAPFIVMNLRDRDLRTVQRVDLPRDWHLVTGNGPLTLKGSETGLVIVSAMVPVKTLAGTYGIRVAVFDAETEKFIALDSLKIVVQPRRLVDVAATQHPNFIISGKSYDAQFVVRNRGNVPSAVSLRARSSMGSAELAEHLLRLGPDESHVVKIHVKDATTTGMSADDVVELIVQADEVKGEVRASGRVTVVPPASTTIDDFQRVPSQVALRAANGSGVSPFVISGSGQLRQGGSEHVDFLLKGKAGATSMFGDRDEYRADFRAPTWRVRAGDHLFSLSPLTSAYQEGTGLGAEKRFGTFGLGGYAEQFRRTPGNAREGGAFVSAYPAPDVRVALNVVDRLDGPLPGQVGSLSANLKRGGVAVEAELARSTDSTSSAGMGHMLHVNGERGGISFDAGHAKGDLSFLGPQRSSEHDYVFASAAPSEFVAVNVSASSHAATLPVFGSFNGRDRLNLATAGVTLGGLLNVEMSGAQHQRRFGALTDESQALLRARVMPNFGMFNANVTAELGRARPDSVTTRQFSDVAVNAGVSGQSASLEAFAERYSGGSILKGLDDILTVGGSANMHVLGIDASAVINANRAGGALSYWFTNIDAQLAYSLSNGSRITARGRVAHGGYGLATSMPPVAYVEYSMPLGLPVSHLHTPGRASGRVIDAATGRGISNALVRLGPQVAITDKKGHVSFGGLPPGEHRVSLSQETSYAHAVFIGDPVLHVDSGAAPPKRFTLALARAVRIELSAREFAVSRTGIAGAADSLVDVGPLTATGFRLIGVRDTLYRTSDETGHVSFTDIAPGKWIIVPEGDVPAFHRFDPERLEVELTAGETRHVIVRLVPKPREVKIMNQNEEVQEIPAQPAASGSSPKSPRQQGLPQGLPQQRRQR